MFDSLFKCHFFTDRATRKRVFFVCLLLYGLARPGQAAVNSEAFLGEPFGVGRVTIDVLRGQPVLPLSDERFTVVEANGRVIYPALKQEPVRRLVRDLLEIAAPRKVTLYYLFQGQEPFDISPYTPNEQGVRVKPQRNAAGHDKLLREWWQQYTKHYETLVKDRAYPPVAENFLIATLSRRLDLPMPKTQTGLLRGLLSRSPSGNAKEASALSYLFVDEAHRLRVDRALVGEVDRAPLELRSLPEPISWPESEPLEGGLEDIDVEPLANHVPAECFYVRFGNFTNYLWFRDLNKKWQGDLGNMLLRRGIKRGASERIQQQLSLRESALAKVLGPQVIADAAIVGMDHYVEQGAAIGILFQAKNDFLLSADLMKQRRAALEKYDDAQEQTLDVDGHSVSLVATPGGEVRSYYAQDEGFHFVTTSRTLVERFLQAGQGDRSLATLASFQRARREFPLERDDTMVAFVSEVYWKNLSSPQWIVENLRRVKSSREPLLLQLARYAAKCEGKLGQSAEELIALEILPQSFGTRADGSELLETETADVQPHVDSLRGARGYYLPIADLPVGKVSAKEAAAFQRFADKLQKSIGQMPPIAAAIHRAAAENGESETISIDVYAQGALRQKLGKVATWLGQPSDSRLQKVAGNLLAVEAVVDFPVPSAGGESPEHHLFGALRDFHSPLAVRRGAVRPDAAPPELVRGYLGAWPKPGLLAWLTGAEAAVGADPQQVGAEMWQAKQADFLLLAFKPEVIQEVLPQLTLEGTERAAQLWLRLEDLTNTQMAENVNALGYMRTRETSAAGSRLMNSLANQLRVPRDQCQAVAQRFVDGRFVCPLGGEYQLYAPQRGLKVWVSSALPKPNQFLLTEVPEDFRLPLLHWFRGLAGDLRLDEQALTAHLEIQMTNAALP